MTLRVGIDWDRSGSFNWSGTDTGSDPNEYHDVSDYVALVQCNRGFEYDPLFSLNVGQATLKLVNTAQYFDWLIDVNLPIIIQYHNEASYQDIWAGTITSYQKETGFDAAFLNLTAKDGGFVVSNTLLNMNYIYDVDQTQLYIAKKLLQNYSNPISPSWRLGTGVLGTTTALGGTSTITVSGNESLASIIEVYTYQDAIEDTQSTRKNPEKQYDVKKMVEDLLNIDGDILIIDGSGDLTLKTYRQLVGESVSASSLNLDSGANKSTFRSVDLANVATVIEVSYATKRYDTYHLLASSDGGKIATGESQEYTLSLAEKATYIGSSVTTSITASGSYTSTTVQDGNRWLVTVTNTSGSELTVSAIKIFGEGYMTEDTTEYVSKDSVLRVDYGTIIRKVNLGCVDSVNLATSLAGRLRSFFAIIRDSIASFTMRKNFITTALTYDVGTVLDLTESKSGITAKPHLITEVQFAWNPQSPEFTFKTIPMSPRAWILGTSLLETATYV